MYRQAKEAKEKAQSAAEDTYSATQKVEKLRARIRVLEEKSDAPSYIS